MSALPARRLGEGQKKWGAVIRPRPFFFVPPKRYVLGMTAGTVHRCDVAIAGGGPVGLTLALALAARGFDVVVADAAAPPGQGPGDSRAYFIAYGCWRIFRALGLEEQLLPHAEPVLQVEAEGRLGGISFIAEECAEPSLGYMIEGSALVAALHAAAKANSHVRLMSRVKIDAVTFGPADATMRVGDVDVVASLIAGCDGAKSLVRKTAELRFEGHDYDAAAISTTIELAKPHEGVARQIFLPRGPMAVLPLKGNRANLIWTERTGVAEALVGLSDDEFERELAKAAGDFLPGAKLAGPRHAFPLRLQVAERFDAHRVALAGDAAHVIHPLAGQGLNLGLKDVAALVDVIAEAQRVGLDIGATSALSPYTTWRRADVAATAAAMEGFARAFTAPLPVRLAAGAAMAAAGVVPGARKLFAKEAGGDLGDVPSLMAR
jgi:2-octaprenyl-6-methoxyphenol hydroxylase